MIGKIIFHYHTFREPVPQDKILENLSQGCIENVYKSENVELKHELAAKFLLSIISAKEVWNV
jgi:hypothetical protein